MFCALQAFLPFWASGEIRDVGEDASAHKGTLPWNKWHPAFDAYMAAAAILEDQPSYMSLFCHRQHVLQARSPAPRRGVACGGATQVAQRAASLGKKAGLALHFDLIARRSWAERSRAGDPGFEVRATRRPLRARRPRAAVQVNRAAQTWDESLLRAAIAAYDAAESKPVKAAAPREEHQARYDPGGKGAQASDRWGDWRDNRGSWSTGSRGGWNAGKGDNKRKRTEGSRRPLTPPRPAK